MSAQEPALPEAAVRRILDRLSGGIVVLDDGGRVRYWNDAATRLLHPHKLRLHEPLPDVETEPTLATVAARLFARGVVGEEELRARDGRTFLVGGIVHAQSHVAVLEIDDMSAGARRSRAEQDFVVNAAHEFLSPLTAVAAAAQVLHDSAKDVPEARDRFIGHILNGANRLISISRALLVLARAEARLEPPRTQVVPLQPLLDELVAGVGASAVVSVRCPEDAGALADPDLLRQALSTLLDNAARHARGTIRVDVELDAYAVIGVSDDGAGMTAGELVHATDRFFSGGANVDAGGFGIGLSIAARAVGVMGGSLSFASQAGGTRARLELPAARLVAA